MRTPDKPLPEEKGESEEPPDVSRPAYEPVTGTVDEMYRHSANNVRKATAAGADAQRRMSEAILRMKNAYEKYEYYRDKISTAERLIGEISSLGDAQLEAELRGFIDSWSDLAHNALQEQRAFGEEFNRAKSDQREAAKELEGHYHEMKARERWAKHDEAYENLGAAENFLKGL